MYLRNILHYERNSNMDSDMKTNRPEITVRYDKKSLQKHLIYAVIFIIIALVSFFAISKWATSVDTYSRIINTLNKLQKKALELTGTATALATGAAAIPGDATTPIANKLADVAGYMVIVYAVIIVEKYLLTITGYIAFKILFPIGCVLMATGNFCKAGWKEFIYRIGIKSIILGILLWGLIPTSVWVTNKVNKTYAKSYDMDFSLEDKKETSTEGNSSSSTTKSNKIDETENNDNTSSITDIIKSFKDKVNDAVETVGTVTSEKINALEKELNKLLEGVAVMIVTTCAIPILVMLAFMWILKGITGLKLPTITHQSVPKVSKTN